VAAIEENKRTDQRGIAILYRGIHGGIIFVDEDHNGLLVNSPKLPRQGI
jgi:hypothetical protein